MTTLWLCEKNTVKYKIKQNKTYFQLIGKGHKNHAAKTSLFHSIGYWENDTTFNLHVKTTFFHLSLWFLIPNKMHFTPVAADSQSFIWGVNELDPHPTQSTLTHMLKFLSSAERIKGGYTCPITHLSQAGSQSEQRRQPVRWINGEMMWLQIKPLHLSGHKHIDTRSTRRANTSGRRDNITN